jgi:hypothetical protein
VAVAGLDTVTDGLGRVVLLDPATLEVRSRSAGPQTAANRFVHYSQDGDRFVTAAAGLVSLWEADTARLLGSWSVEGADSAGFLEDTDEVLIASSVPSVSVWDPRPRSAVESACRLAGRDLTAHEWATVLPNRPAASVCPD